MDKGDTSGPRDIGERTLDYSLRAIRLYRFIEGSRDGAARLIGRQYLRCATSIGANVQESRAGESRADFVHKVAIAQKEARESIYWLRLLLQSELIPEGRIMPLLAETKEILAVLSAIIVKARRQSNFSEKT